MSAKSGREEGMQDGPERNEKRLENLVGQSDARVDDLELQRDRGIAFLELADAKRDGSC